MMTENHEPETDENAWAKLLPPIFADCVGPDWPKADMSRPYVIDGHIYAMDGKIAIRMPAPDSWDIPNPARVYQKVGSAFEPTGGIWLTPRIPPVEEACSWCLGSGISPPVRCVCQDCGCEIDRGERPCDRCDGFKVERPGERLEVVPGYFIARGYASLLRRHRVTNLMIPESLDHKRPALFALGEIEGRLMPMSPPDEPDASKP